ncbi:MAG TPA: TetR/AcrR family transcriptional regulator [Solirubrobacteraceae bacterium]|jgi:TetR/AcrR family transcriptional repressor of nem operon
MRHSEDEKRRSHERIVEAAARRIREAGTDGPGVAEIMSAAGMTHGGFYKHFGSRDELIAEAAEVACADGSGRLNDAIADAANPLSALITTYLSADHRDDPGTGCAVAALGSDAARPGNAARPAYTEQIRRYIDRLQSLLAEDGATGEARERAIATVSTLVGALTISRAVEDPELADEVLAGARDVLLAAAG